MLMVIGAALAAFLSLLIWNNSVGYSQFSVRKLSPGIVEARAFHFRNGTVSFGSVRMVATTSRTRRRIQRHALPTAGTDWITVNSIEAEQSIYNVTLKSYGLFSSGAEQLIYGEDQDFAYFTEFSIQWLIYIPLGLLALRLWMIYRAGGLRLAVPGVCNRCGYDLRASPVICPECGTAATAEPA